MLKSVTKRERNLRVAREHASRAQRADEDFNDAAVFSTAVHGTVNSAVDGRDSRQANLAQRSKELKEEAKARSRVREKEREQQKEQRAARQRERVDKMRERDSERVREREEREVHEARCRLDGSGGPPGSPGSPFRVKEEDLADLFGIPRGGESSSSEGCSAASSASKAAHEAARLQQERAVRGQKQVAKEPFGIVRCDEQGLKRWAQGGDIRTLLLHLHRTQTHFVHNKTRVGWSSSAFVLQS